MINPDQLITAELLAGLTKCPFCGAKPYEIKPESKEFECHSVLHTESRAASCVSSWCQIATLRARVKELEEALEPFAKTGTMQCDEFGFCVHCKHHPVIDEGGWCTEDPKDHTPDCYWIKARNLIEKGTK